MALRRGVPRIVSSAIPETEIADHSLGASIVDPHGDYLADARAKLQALAKFAEDHGNRAVRIESVAKVEDGSLRVLDLLETGVREASRHSREARSPRSINQRVPESSFSQSRT